MTSLLLTHPSVRAWTTSTPTSSPRCVSPSTTTSDSSTKRQADLSLTAQYKVNALGVIHGISAFLPLLRAAPTKKIVVIGSSAGHPKFVQTSGFGDMPAYSMTKAAALIATTKWAIKLKDEGFIVVTINPGLVDTSGTREEKGESLTPPGISSGTAGLDCD